MDTETRKIILSITTQELVKTHEAALDTVGKNYYVANGWEEYATYVSNKNSLPQPEFIICDFRHLEDLVFQEPYNSYYFRKIPIIVAGDVSNAALADYVQNLNIVGTMSFADQKKPEEFFKLSQAFDCAAEMKGRVTEESFAAALGRKPTINVPAPAPVVEEPKPAPEPKPAAKEIGWSERKPAYLAYNSPAAPATKPVTKPAVKEAAKAVTKPASKKAAKPAAKAAAKPAKKPHKPAAKKAKNPKGRHYSR